MQTLTLTFDNGPQPLYQQLYKRLAEEISSGRMKPGERLPSKRGLGDHLQISVNTVAGAYEMLTEEGYIESRPRSGFVVARIPQPIASKKTVGAPAPTPSVAPVPQAYRYDLRTSLVDPDAFPFSTWAKLTKNVMMRGKSLLAPGEAQGERVLREVLMEHLREFRGVNASAEQMVIGAGMEYLLGLLAKLTDAQTAYALEDPGYVKNRRILDNNGVPYKLIEMDASGMRVDRLRTSGAAVAYITPTHQYPMGTTMPVGRRLELIAWAEETAGRTIIEDDYDSEFRYSGRPVPSLSGLTSSEKVVYIGTMSRSISPSVRIAYMVLPNTLLQEYRRRFGIYACTVSVFEQNTLAEFITGGHLVRHLNRVRTLCRKRRDLLVSLLEHAFGARIRIGGSTVGLHLLATLSDGPGEKAMRSRAEAVGIRLTGLSEYRGSPSTRIPCNTVVLGYAALKEADIRQIVKLLASAWSPALRIH